MRRALAFAALASFTLTGCSGAQSLPLPGGEGTGSDAYEVTVEFSDVLDLVRQSSVKVDDVSVGSVSDIQLDGYTARVTVKVRPDVVLPANASASLKQTSLLGEKFVSLERPTTQSPVGRLRDGDVIPLARTKRSTEVEEVLGALSLVLNGGSLEQIQTINSELVDALDGREAEVKDLLGQLETFVGGLDEQKTEIVRALDALDRLTARLADQREVLAVALRDIPKGSAVLSDQREQLVQVLTGLNRLGDVATRVIRASQQNTVADLKALQPILTQLNAAGKDLPQSLELLLTYPFPRSVSEGIKGDYANLFITLDLTSETLEQNLGSEGESGGTPQLPVPVPTGLPSTLPTLPGITGKAPSVPLPTKLPVPVPTSLTGRVPTVLPTPTAKSGVRLPDVLGGLTGTRNDLLALLLGGLS